MKSYVSLETKQCIVCGQVYDTSTILIDKRMKDNLERHICTGIGLCPEHQEKFDAGYVAFIGCNIEKSEFLPNGNIKPEKAYRTGNVAFLKHYLVPELFNMPIPKKMPAVFCDDKIITGFLRNIPIEGESHDDQI